MYVENANSYGGSVLSKKWNAKVVILKIINNKCILRSAFMLCAYDWFYGLWS